ncbi:MAG: hypothetical protein JRF33_21250 [Deltaproteobacteria bacterium]|nr:hypothetical protein [Deltaproteobacteria bacterium]
MKKQNRRGKQNLLILLAGIACFCWACGTTNNFSGTVELPEDVQPAPNTRLHVAAFLDSEMDEDDLPTAQASYHMHLVEDSPDFPYFFSEITKHNTGAPFAFIAWLEEDPEACLEENCPEIYPVKGDAFGVHRAVNSVNYGYHGDILIDRVVP